MALAGPGMRRLRSSVGPDRHSRRERVHDGLVLGAAAVSWVALVAAHATDFAHHLHHDDVLHDGAAWAGLLVFLGGWLLMVVAMMLPLVRPSLRAAPRTRSVATFVLGFVLVWLLAGAVLLGVDAAVHEAVHAVPALGARPWLIAAAVLALAAATQLAPGTERHLARCTMPWSGWQDGQAMAGGGRYGLVCMRADGPLMLVMFAAGGGLAWMAAVAVVMAAERRPAGRRRVIRAAGVALLAAALVTAIAPGGLPGPLNLAG